MVQIQSVSPTTSTSNAVLDYKITDEDIGTRENELMKVSKRGSSYGADNYKLNIRNNILLDKLLDNQNKIMQKLGIGENLDKQV